MGYSVYPHTLEARMMMQQLTQWRWCVISCVLKILWHLLILGSSICLLLIRRKSSSLSSVLCQLFYQTKLSSWSGISLIRWERAKRGVTNLQKLKQWPYSWLKGRRPKIPPGWKSYLVAYLLQWQQTYFHFFLKWSILSPIWIRPGPSRRIRQKGIKRAGEKVRNAVGKFVLWCQLWKS